MRARDLLGGLTAEVLRELLTYDPETGVFARAVRVGGRGRLGARADRVHRGTGYVVVKMRNRLYYAHRLAWLYMTGDWPVALVDHINGDRADCRWANLRAATKGQNNANSKAFSASGLKGVSRRGSRWAAWIHEGEILRALGTFDTPEQASDAYMRAAVELHGDFARRA